MRRAPRKDANHAAVVKALEMVGVRKLFGVWKCATCKEERPATVHQLRKTYCSTDCMVVGYRDRMRGESNPNFRSLPVKPCIWCGAGFKSYNKSRKYCSRNCFASSMKGIRPKNIPRGAGRVRALSPAPRIGAVTTRKAYELLTRKAKRRRTTQKRNLDVLNCLECGTEFSSYKSSGRKFCGYACFVKSGGPRRAGDAAVVARRRYGAKKDANHNEVFEAMLKIVPVRDLSSAGFGVPDGIAWIDGKWQLFDIKNLKTGYGRRGLNPIQKKWAEGWRGGPVYLIHDVDEAVRFATGKFDGIKTFPDADAKDRTVLMAIGERLIMVGVPVSEESQS